jgi:trehalose 6-phosphate phosphatase
VRHLFSQAGEAAMAGVMALDPLLAFDFDGTLAPIVPRPADARLSLAVSTRLARLAERHPVAIVSGRSVEDVRSRLGFEPTYVVGSHGAEDPAAADASAVVPALDVMRARFAAMADRLRMAEVVIEDKRYSIALHYRLARDRIQARALIGTLLDPLPPSLHAFGGKCVENIVAADAPDKADAVRRLLERSGRTVAVFLGDDVNDEPVFETAPPQWLTVRIGRSTASASAARFFLDSPGEVATMLERLLVLARHAPEGG